MEYANVLQRLRRLRQLPRGRNGRGRWVASCPAHDDRTPSLCLWVDDKGWLACQCRSGCSFDSVCAALGTDKREWSTERPMSDEKPIIVATYDYTDAEGNLLYQKVRLQPKNFYVRRPTLNGWLNGMGEVQQVPYKLRELMQAKPDMPLVIVEGEKDVESVLKFGLLATTNCFGAGKWPLEFGRYLARRRIAVIPDNDHAGHLHAVQVLGCAVFSGAREVRLVHLPGVRGGGDVTDWLAAAAEPKRDNLIGAIRAAPVYHRSPE